jgi:branched-subunit amino acid ABC-type transport system permease component
MNIVIEIVSGLTIGCIYGLVAIGFSMIFRAMGLVNFAQGDLMMLGGFMGYTCLSIAPGMPFPLVVLAAMLIVGVFGYVIERIAFRPAVERNASQIYLVLLTLGIGIVLANAARLIWGANPIVYKIPLAHDVVQIGGYPLPKAYFYIIGFMTLLMFALDRTVAAGGRAGWRHRGPSGRGQCARVLAGVRACLGYRRRRGRSLRAVVLRGVRHGCRGVEGLRGRRDRDARQRSGRGGRRPDDRRDRDDRRPAHRR